MSHPFQDLCGWKFLPREIEKVAQKQKFYRMSSVGLQANEETTLLYKFVKQTFGSYIVRRQGIGDCVSMGAACAVDHIKAVQIALKNIAAEFKTETCTEAIYGLSRVEIGGGQLRGGDGSSGSWAAEAVKRYGTLCRGLYDKWDLSNYSANLARDWGDTGLPDELEPIAHEHLIQVVTQCHTVDDVKACITNGYPVTIACNTGFNSTRDKNGFAWPGPIWPHQQCIIAYRNDIEGFCIQNSWGPEWISGPLVLDQPEGSYWITSEVLDDIFNAGDADMWSYSNFDSYLPQKLNLRWV